MPPKGKGIKKNITASMRSDTSDLVNLYHLAARVLYAHFIVQGRERQSRTSSCKTPARWYPDLICMLFGILGR